MKPSQKYADKINNLRNPPPAPAPPEMSDMEEAASEGESASVEGVENKINEMLGAAEKAGTLAVLEPHVAASGCSDTKDLMRKAQALEETRGKPPEELANMLASDPGLAKKIGGGGATASSGKMSYKDKIQALRESGGSDVG